VTWLAATASDNCDLTLPITYDFDVNDDGTVDASQSGTTYTFPGGTHRVTARTTDACGNTGSDDFLVTVSASNELKVTVELEWPFSGTRCVTFELWNCGPPVIGLVEKKQVLTFVSGMATDAVVLVPCNAYYECITARDALHTLRTTVTPSIVDTQYVASFTGGDKLLGGNLNDDYYIDILDFGVFSWKYGTIYKDGVEVPGPDRNGNTTCSTTYPHADISGDGLVDLADFSFIQINFLKTNQPNCCGQPNFRGDAGPVTRISVADLIAQGLGELAVGDVNADGWLDELDMAEFAAGLPPPGLVGDLNCDGLVDFGDINPFVLALTNPGQYPLQYPNCNIQNADVNRDGNVNFGDINPFVALLQQ
jgi:hypothetical protein